MAKIKISYKTIEKPTYTRNARKQRQGYCKFCGSLLKSEKSKKRGFGHVCAGKVGAMIILEIPPAKDSEN